MGNDNSIKILGAREHNLQNVDIVQFAIDYGTSYKMLRTLNPWIATDTFKNKAGKSYKVKIPTKNGTSHHHIVKGKHDTTVIERI